MIKALASIIIVFLIYNQNRYYIKTGDSSLQGFIEYLKIKYYYSKEKPEPPINTDTFYKGKIDPPIEQQPHKPSQGSTADYERWKAEREKGETE